MVLSRKNAAKSSTNRGFAGPGRLLHRNRYRRYPQKRQHPLPKHLLREDHGGRVVAGVEGDARRIPHARLIAQGDFVRLVKPQAQRAHAPAGQVQAALQRLLRGKAQARHPQRLAHHRRAKRRERLEQHQIKPRFLAVAQQYVFADGYIRPDKGHAQAVVNGKGALMLVKLVGNAVIIQQGKHLAPRGKQVRHHRSPPVNSRSRPIIPQMRTFV